MSGRYTPKEIEIRFWSRVEITPDCWFWLGALDGDGYGRLQINYQQLRVHRYSYELHTGPVPNDLCVCHHCDCPSCVNPNHLFLGTNLDNIIDRCQKDRSARLTPNPKVLPQEQVDEIRRKYVPFAYPQSQLAEEYGVSQVTINRIINHFRGYEA